MKCISDHFTFDKGESDCEVFLYLMTGKSILVSLYYGGRGFVFKSVPNCRAIVFCDIIVHCLKEHQELI